MTKRIFRGIFLSTFITLIICALLVLISVYGYFGKTASNELKTRGNLIAEAINTEGTAYLDRIKNSENRITLIEKSGTVIFDNSISANTAENHAEREEVKKAIEYGSGTAERYSSSLGTNMIYYAVLLKNGQILRISATRASVINMFAGTVPYISAALAFSIILSAVLAVTISRKIVKPINEIDPENPGNLAEYEEISPLLRKINSQNRKIKKQIELLSEKQKEFSIITENMSEGILIIDDKTDILTSNSAAIKLLSDGGNYNNKSVFALNRSDNFRTAVETALEGKSGEALLLTGDRTYQIMASPVITDGKISGAVIVVLDITEKEQRDRLRREFSSNVSHELKTPLTSIYGISDMLAGGMVKPEDVTGFAEDIKKQSSRLISLVDDILKLSKLDENAVTEEKTNVNLLDVSQKVMELLKNKAKEKNIKLSFSGENIVITAYPSLIEETVYNLCENGIKYGKDNGFVKISVTEDDFNTIIAVSDNGIGIASADRQRVFERFYRADKSHSKKTGGTGLGLSIVKHAAEYHGGNAEISSIPDKGTTVTVTVPKNSEID